MLLASSGLSPPPAAGLADPAYGPRLSGRPWNTQLPKRMTGAARLRPVLADEPRTVRREGAVCLAPEEGLGDPGAGEGVQEAEEDGEDDDRDDGATEMGDHVRLANQ